MELRDYQKRAVDKCLWAMGLQGNDLLQLPTGSGKSLVIADLAHKINRPLLILQPSIEILQQNAAKMAMYVPKKEIGIYSASANRKDISTFTFATIQSIYKKPKEFAEFGIALLDEAHFLNPKNLNGMFSSFIEAVSEMRGARMKCFGFSATPYRNVTGYHEIDNDYGGKELEASLTLKLLTRMKSGKNGSIFWNRLVYNINNRELVNKGYLCPLKYVDERLFRHEDLKMNRSKSDFDEQDVEQKTLSRKIKILNCIRESERKFNSVLVFCTSVKQAFELAREIPGSHVVTGKTDKKSREKMIEGFKSGAIKTMLNVGVLTTGFDHPALDCVVLLRPTRSLSLYYQMAGRGSRIAPGKTHCTFIDFTSTVENLGTIESIEMRKDERTNNKWELFTDATPLLSWHNRSLYSYKMARKSKVIETEENIPDYRNENDFLDW